MEYINPQYKKCLDELIKDNFKLGEPQKNLPTAFASHDAVENFTMPSSGSEIEIGIMSYNIPSKEWNAEHWIDWLKGIHKKFNSKIKVLGGPKIEALEVVSALTKDEIIDLRLLPFSPTLHILYATNPQQLLVEEYHDWGQALRFHYTAKPFRRSWEMLRGMFDMMWQAAKPVQKFDSEVIEDITASDLIIMYLLKHKRTEYLKFTQDLINITNQFHKEGLAKRIHFAESLPIGTYHSESISEALRYLMGFNFVKTEYKGQDLFYELTKEGGNFPIYAQKSHCSAWNTLQKHSHLVK